LPIPTNVPLHHTIATLSAPPRCTITSRLRQARGTENVVRCKPVGFSGGVKGASVSGHGITMFV